MKRIIIAAVALCSIAITSCRKISLRGEGATVTETRPLSSFTDIEANGDVDIRVYPSNENKIVLTAYQNLIPAFETNVNGNRLKLQYKREYINVRNNNMKIELYVTDVKSLSLNGSGKVMMHPSLPTKDLRLSMNGSGKFEVYNNNLDNLSCSINGSGDIILDNNRIIDLRSEISGSGKLNGRNSNCDNVYARIDGSGDIYVTVSNSLDAGISGSGDIYYWGNPATINTKISGSGKVHKN